MNIRRLLLGMHRYLGLIAAIPVILAALSGAILVFEVELDRALNPTYWTAHPRGSPRSWQELAVDVRQANQGDPVTSLRLPASPQIAGEFNLRSGLSVAVDPYSGQILGKRHFNDALPSRVHRFHTRLLLGKWGSRITGISAIVLLIICVSGLILWWRRRTYGIRWAMPWRRINYDAHYALGLYGLLPWLIFATTGAAITFEDSVRPILYSITHTKPAESPVLRSVPVAHAKPLSLDQALVMAGNGLPGARITLISLPAGKTGVFTCFMKFPEDHTPAGRSRLALDQFSGRTLWLASSRTSPAGTRLWNLTRPVHTGDVFGWPSRLLACTASLMLALQVISGIGLWLSRRTKHSPVPEIQQTMRG